MPDWTADNWGRDHANSWADEESCLSRKVGHDGWCGTDTEWVYVSEATRTNWHIRTGALTEPPTEPPTEPSNNYVTFGTGACRGTSTSHNPGSWYTRLATFNGDVKDCQEECTSLDGCVAIEFKPGSSTHCELWTQMPQATSGDATWTCMRPSEDYVR